MCKRVPRSFKSYQKLIIHDVIKTVCFTNSPVQGQKATVFL